MNDFGFMNYGSESACTGSSLNPDLDFTQTQVQEDNSWENLMRLHHMRTYGTSKEEFSREMSGEGSVDRVGGVITLPSPKSSHITPPPSAHLKSPVKCRRLVERILNSYDHDYDPSRKGISNRGYLSPKKLAKNMNPPTNDTDAKDRRYQSESANLKKANLQSAKGEGRERGGTWKESPLALIALKGEEDELAGDFDELLSLVQQHGRSGGSHRGSGRNDVREAEEQRHAQRKRQLERIRGQAQTQSQSQGLLECYPAALGLLHRLHRDLRCPPHLHKAFHTGYCHPSAFNLAVVLSRIFTLFDSRALLLEVIRVAGGQPSANLVARVRMQQQEKDESSSPARGDRAGGDLSLLSLPAQSPKQIRDRARATTLAILADSVRGKPNEGDTGGGRGSNTSTTASLQLEQGQGQGRSRSRSSLLISVADMRKDLVSSSSSVSPVASTAPPAVAENENVLKPSEMLTGINEYDEGNVDSDGDESSSLHACTERIGDVISLPLLQRRGSVLSVTVSGTTPHRASPASGPAFVVKTVLLQTAAEEWFASVPWTVSCFTYGELEVVNKPP